MSQAARKPHLVVVQETPAHDEQAVQGLDEAQPRQETRPSPAAKPSRDRHPADTRLSTRAAIAVAAVAAAVCGGALALAIDPFGGDAPSPAAPPPAAAVWKRLDAERADLRALLAAADTPQEQAGVADRLASTYESAARRAGAGRDARAARAVRDAYTRLAASAQAGNAAGYAAASEAVARAEERLQARR